MAYSEFLADRIRVSLNQKNTNYLEKKMFGGMCFMVDEKMCVGIIGDELMVRIDPEIQDELLARPGARVMDFTHRPMKGYLNVNAQGIDMDTDLDDWVQLCLDFNPKAKSSKKKKKA